MQVRLVRRRRVIAPFGVEVDACAVGTTTFGAWRSRLLRELCATVQDANLEEHIAGPALVWSDDVWLSRRALRGFLRVATREAVAARLCLPPSRLLELFLPLQDVERDAHGRAAFDVALVPAGATATPAELFALDADRWRAPGYREIPLALPAPRHILRREESSIVMPLTSTVAMRVRHWLHVLRAGHLAPQVMLLDRASARPLQTLLRLAASVRTSRRSSLRALRARLVYAGRNTFIHPTATVEASVLGDDVQIGAYSYVVNSVVGSGSVIEQRAHVSGCALGPRTFVSLNSSLQACVTFGDTDACINGVQACVIGPRCALTSFARPLDLALAGSVCVEDGGGLRPVGELPCGVAFGPDVFVGADVVIAAGRAIQAGVRLFMDGRRVLHRLPPDLSPGAYAIVDGRPQRIDDPAGSQAARRAARRTDPGAASVTAGDRLD